MAGLLSVYCDVTTPLLVPRENARAAKQRLGVAEGLRPVEMFPRPSQTEDVPYLTSVKESPQRVHIGAASSALHEGRLISTLLRFGLAAAAGVGVAYAGVAVP